MGYDELAARAHYPSDILKEAENGPSLPTLPILAAFVRACDGDVPTWEERWRCLGLESHADPSLPVRPAGTSPAAAAGARAGISIAPPDMYDPDRIRAALRSQPVHADQAAQGTAHQARTEPDAEGVGSTAVAASGWGGTASWDTDAGTGTAAGWSTDTDRDQGSVWNGGTSWDAGSAWGTGANRDAAADPSNVSANGNHHAGPQGAGTQGAGTLDAPVTETPSYAGGPRGIRHDPFSASWLQDSELTGPAPDAGSGREQDGPASAGRTDFWAPSAGPGPALPPVQEQPAGPSLPQDAASAVPAQSQATAKPAVQQTTAAPPNENRRDRLYPLRLLAVIVVAALIGSILVLLIR